jgi:hypothetical protein
MAAAERRSQPHARPSAVEGGSRAMSDDSSSLPRLPSSSTLAVSYSLLVGSMPPSAQHSHAGYSVRSLARASAFSSIQLTPLSRWPPISRTDSHQPAQLSTLSQTLSYAAMGPRQQRHPRQLRERPFPSPPRLIPTVIPNWMHFSLK